VEPHTSHPSLALVQIKQAQLKLLLFSITSAKLPNFLFPEMLSYSVFEGPQILEFERHKEKEATNHHVGEGVLK
jgi:hypothetical protein